MTKGRIELSVKIQKLADRGVRKARAAAKKAGVPVCYAKDGKLVYVNL